STRRPPDTTIEIAIRMISPRTSSAFIFASLLASPAIRAADASPRGGIDASPSLEIPTTASAQLGPDGFLSRWLVLEPIPGDGRVTDSAVQAAAKKEYFPGQC